MDHTEISGINGCVLIEILIYLPIKSLLRFKCVSKYWCTLIKSPTFQTRHLGRGCKETLLVKRYLPAQDRENPRIGGEDILSFHDPDCPELLVSPNIVIPFFGETYHEQIDLYGPCNGLVCFIFQDIVVLSNPALREFKLLAPSSFACPDGYRDINYGSGFGFDANTNEYKIIQMWQISEMGVYYYFNADSCIRIDLYNSSTNSWRIIYAAVPEVSYYPGFDVFFNGTFHWHASELFEGEGADDMGNILSFDVGTEVFRRFGYPFHFEKSCGLVVLNMHLALLHYGNGPIDVWIMKEYGVTESWTKELVIAPYHFRCPFFCWKNGWLLVETVESQLASCALYANEIKKYQFYGYEGTFRPLIFTESLVSLNEVFWC